MMRHTRTVLYVYIRISCMCSNRCINVVTQLCIHLYIHVSVKIHGCACMRVFMMIIIQCEDPKQPPFFRFCQNIFESADFRWSLGDWTIYHSEVLRACRGEILQSPGIATFNPLIRYRRNHSGLLSLEVTGSVQLFAFGSRKPFPQRQLMNMRQHHINRTRCHWLKHGRKVAIDSEHEPVGIGKDWHHLKDCGGTEPEQDWPNHHPSPNHWPQIPRLRNGDGHSQDSHPQNRLSIFRPSRPAIFGRCAYGLNEFLRRNQGDELHHIRYIRPDRFR